MGISLKKLGKSVSNLGKSVSKAVKKTVSNVKAIEKKVESNAKSPLVGTILSTVNPAVGLSWAGISSVLFKPKQPPPEEVTYEEGPAATDETLPDQVRLSGAGDVGSTPFSDLIMAMMNGGTLSANAKTLTPQGSSISTSVKAGDKAPLTAMGLKKYILPAIAVGLGVLLLFLVLRRKK